MRRDRPERPSPAGDFPALEGVELTPTAASVTEEAISLEAWKTTLHRLLSLERSAPWWVGDLLAFGEKRYGETYTAALRATGRRIQTLKNYAWVARRVPAEVRDPRLPWGAHRAVAKLREPDEQREWLARAAEEGWTADELERELRVPDDDDDGAPQDEAREAAAEGRLPTNQNDDLDAAAHWAAAGMPDCDPPEEPYRLIVSFETEADRDEFLSKIGSPTIRNRSGRTWSIWWPDRPKDDVKSVEFR